MKAAIFSNHSPRVGFGVDRKMDVSRSQVMVVAASRNHLYRRRLQVVIDAGPRNHLYLLGQQVKIRSSPRNQNTKAKSIDYKKPRLALAGGVFVCTALQSG
jgi:hypothetical protein